MMPSLARITESSVSFMPRHRAMGANRHAGEPSRAPPHSRFDDEGRMDRVTTFLGTWWRMKVTPRLVMEVGLVFALEDGECHSSVTMAVEVQEALEAIE